MLSRQEGWNLSKSPVSLVPGDVFGSECAEYGWKIKILMGNLENCCAHSLIALNKQYFTGCSWITVLHGQHYDHGEAPLIGLALTWGHYTRLKGPCSICLSLSNPLGFCSTSTEARQRRETRWNSATEVCELSALTQNSLRKPRNYRPRVLVLIFVLATECSVFSVYGFHFCVVELWGNNSKPMPYSH